MHGPIQSHKTVPLSRLGLSMFQLTGFILVQASEHFRCRLRRAPRQIVRYCRRGAPLLCTSSLPLASPPPCTRCGAPRTFEFQVRIPSKIQCFVFRSGTIQIRNNCTGSGSDMFLDINLYNFCKVFKKVQFLFDYIHIPLKNL
jgi:hypothetical protein